MSNVIQMGDQMRERAAVVAEAKEWVGTPYHHMARVKQAGTDCGQLLLGIFEAVELIPHVDPGFYTHDWHMHNSQEIYLSFVEQLAARRADNLELTIQQRLELDNAYYVPAGDILVWRVGRTFSHGAVVTRWPNIIHAYFPAGKVEEVSVLNTPMATRPMRVYSYWGT
jgi:cell wall-associated NlpC family hydrolase